MSSAEESKSQEVALEHVIKKSDTGLVFYRKCTVDGQSYNVNNTVLLRDEGRYKLGYLLKIYCRTKGNERALVRWFFTDSDFGQHIKEQHYSHEIFATSYTGKVAVSSIRKLLHVIWVAIKDEIPTSVPKDVYYVYRYFDHDKQALVLHRQQLLQIRYMPKPSPDSVGSSLSVKEKADVDVSTISFTLPYIQNGATFYKVCTIGKDKYKIGDCVLLGDRDGSSIRRIISFSYNHENRPIAMGQFIYYQNEVTLSPEERMTMHFQEVLVSNWKRELLISNIKRKLIVIHQNIFQPVPENALKAVYFLKRYYDPFKKKIYPLAEPLTRSDFSIVPAPMEECEECATLVEPFEPGAEHPCFRKCTLGEDNFSVGDFVTLQSGSVCVKVLRFYNDLNADQAVMDVNKLFTIRNVPSTDRSLLSTSLLFSSEVYHKVPCNLFFEKICVVYNSAEIANDATFIAGDFFDAETKELYKLWKPAKLLGTEEVPKAGMSLRKLYQPRKEENSVDTLSSSSSNSESEEKEYRPPSKKKKRKLENERKEKKSKKAAKNENEERPRPKKPEKEEQVIKFVDDINEQKQEKTTKTAGDIQSKVGDFYSDLETKEVVLGSVVGDMEYSWLSVGTAKAAVGDCVFVRLTEGIQMGRIISIYKEHKNATDPVRLKLFRIYLEEEMFVSKRESASIHVNEAFATDFVIHALACQVDETVDVVYLKKKEKIPPQNEIPKGRLFIRRYYHPLRHLLRTLAEPLDSADLSIIPQPHPPINGHNEEDMNLNRKPCIPDGWSGTVRYSDEKESDSRDVVPIYKVSTSEANQSSANESGPESEKVTVAVLEPKSVLSQSSDSTELPFSGLSDLAEQSSSDPAVNATSVVDDTEPTTNITISIVSESDINSETSMMILPSNMISFTVSNDEAVQQNPDQQTIQIVPSTATDQQTIQIVPSIADEPTVITSNQPETTPATDQKSVAIVPSSQLNTIEIVPQAMSCSGTNQIQIMTGDSNQVQVIDSSSIQIVPSTDTTSSSSPFLPTIISSEQDMHTDMDVDITHAADGCITIAPVTTKRNNTAKFEDSYTKNGRVYFRKCHFKDETIVQGEAVYVRCNDQNPNSEEESWKLGRVMEFYHASYPVVRLLWFYVEEEMVTSIKERAGIHPQEVFASQCDDEVEISSIESKANVIYLKKGDGIPKVTPETNLFCRRYYDPYKHSIKPLKNRLSATDVSILPEPMVAAKRGRSSTPSTPLEATTPNTKRKKTSLSKQGATPRKQSPRKSQTANAPLQTAKTPLQTANPPRQMPFFSPRIKDKVTESNTNDNKDKPKLFFASEEKVEGSKNDEAVSNKVEMGLEVPIVSSVIEKSDSTESMISIIQTESTIITIQDDSTIPTIQAESTIPTIQDDSTIPIIQAKSTIPTIQADSTISTIQAESTIPAIQDESTIPTIQAESTIPTIQAESTIQTIPADIPDHSKIAAKDNDHNDIVAIDIPVAPENPSEEMKECDSVTEKVEIEVSPLIQLSAGLTENPQNIDPEQTTLSSSHEQPLAMLSDPPAGENQVSLEEAGSETETPETKLVEPLTSNTELYDSKEVEHADEIVQVIPQIKNVESLEIEQVVLQSSNVEHADETMQLVPQIKNVDSLVTKQVVPQTSNTELDELKNAVDPASVENVEKENVDSDSCVTL